MTASDVMELTGASADGRTFSGLFADTYGDGNAGDLTIATGQLTVRGAWVSASTRGTGAGGRLSVTASDVELIGTAAHDVFFGTAKGLLGSGLYADTSGDGNAGDLTIATGQLTVRDGARVSAITTGTGSGGRLSVTASDVELIGRSPSGNFPSGLYSETQGDGNAGDLTIATGRLTVRDGALVSARAFSKSGSGGRLSVTASDVVELIGISVRGVFDGGLYTSTSGGGNAGNLTITTGRLTVRDGSQVWAVTSGTGSGGRLSVTASDVVELIGVANSQPNIGSSLSSQTFGDGNAGDLTIATGRLSVQGGGFVSARTIGSGAGGRLSVTASDVVELIGTTANGQYASGLYSETNGDGNAGDLTIATGRLTVQGGALVSARTIGTGAGGRLSVTASDVVELSGTSANDRFSSALTAQTEGNGDAGDLTIATGRLTVQGGAYVSAGTFGTGAGGRLSVTASDVELFGRSANGQFTSALSAQTQGNGNAGDLTIATGRLTVRDGAYVSATTTGMGSGGRLSVTASDVVELIGTSANGRVASGLYSQTEGDGGNAGNAGDLTIATGRLTVRDGALVSAGTFGTGAAGRLSVTASDVVELIGRSANGRIASGLYTSTSGDGNAGDLKIITGRLTVRDGAEVAVRSFGLGNAGSLRVEAGSVLLENQGKLRATTASGEGGNIELQVQDLTLMRRNSLISAEAEGTGNGGNITINGPFIIAVPSENNDIFASAIQGRGGNINITTQGIYGLEYHSSLTSGSDINASSQFGVSGTVEINNPDVDPSQGLVELPAELVDASNSFATGCAGSGENEFIITGRGGLPANPRQVLSSSAVQVEWVELDASAENRASVEQERGNRGVRRQEKRSIPAYNTVDVNRPVREVVEAQGWIADANGNVTLVATAPTAMPHSSWQIPAECRAPVGR